jgi:uncharacterized membrane protein HdeD (DUF308 family)
MTKLLNNRKWIVVLVLGLILIIIGLLVIAYDIIGASFLLGFGMGYVICSSIIRELEGRIQSPKGL